MIPFGAGLAVAVTLFVLGVLGVLVRRNLLFVLMSVEVQLNAAALALVVAGARWGQADGQVLVILVLATAAAEAAVGLAVLLEVNRRLRTLDADLADRLKG